MKLLGIRLSLWTRSHEAPRVRYITCRRYGSACLEKNSQGSRRRTVPRVSEWQVLGRKPLAKRAQRRRSTTKSFREPTSQHSPTMLQLSLQSSITAWAAWKLMRIQQSWALTERQSWVCTQLVRSRETCTATIDWEATLFWIARAFGRVARGARARNVLNNNTKASYRYTATKGTCKASSRNVEFSPGSVTGYRDVSTDNEQTLMSIVARQPVSIAIEVNQSLFQSYSSGMLNASCGTKLDHSVLAVGYGTDAGSEFLGSSWGEQSDFEVTSM